jgi:hypothetical protein
MTTDSVHTAYFIPNTKEKKRKTWFLLRYAKANSSHAIGQSGVKIQSNRGVTENWDV